MRRFLLVALLTALAGAAHAQSWLDQPGVVGSTTVELGNARVRLPPGEWRQVAETSFTYKGEQIPIVERVFIQSEGQRVVALAYMRTNTAPATSRRGFLPDGDCFRSDVFFNDSTDVYPGQFDCVIVNHWILRWTTTPVPPLWQQALDAAATVGGTPRPLVGVELAKASPSRTGFLVLRIAVNPAVSGFTSNPNVGWAESEWHKDNATPDRVAFLKKLAAWGEAYRPIFRKSWD